MPISILYAILVLGITGILASSILYFVAQRFKMVENPLIDEIVELLPAANCGGCGFAGCRSLAEAIVKAGNTDALFCPVGGNATAAKIGKLLGIQSKEITKQIAVLRCNGSLENSSRKALYEGINDCRFAHNIFVGEGGCSFGCLGMGNCIKACSFNAIYLNTDTKLPVIDENKCTACKACIKACPRNIIEIRSIAHASQHIFVACMNNEKGGNAKKNCNAACIGCSKCQRVCPFQAITIENNLAYIDFTKCRLCKKCIAECPTGAIVEMNLAFSQKENLFKDKS